MIDRANLTADELATLEAVGEDFITEWEVELEGLNAEQLEALVDFIAMLRTMTQAERVDMARSIRRARLTPEAARAAIVAELEAGREPAGELLGDWLAVDPALKAFFRAVMRPLLGPEVLRLSSQGFVASA